MDFFVIIALHFSTALAILHPLFFPTSEKENYRITNGRPAVPGQIPYQIALNFITANGSFWCGGSLIGSQWILTAAHCTDGALNFTIYLGTVNTSSPRVSQQVNSISAIPHPGYNRDTLENDIALLKIQAVQLSSFIKVIAIPGFSNANLTFVNEKAVTAGWGKTKDQDLSLTEILQWANVSIGDNSICSQYYGVYFKPSMICVPTSGATSNCQGDSGGPLVIDKNEVLVGVFSYFPAEGCEQSRPVVFTRVTSYLQWIRDVSGIYYA